jgi:hypothetical protein
MVNAIRRAPSTIAAIMSGKFVMFAKRCAFIATACPVPEEGAKSTFSSPFVVTSSYCGCSVGLVGKREGGRTDVVRIADIGL